MRLLFVAAAFAGASLLFFVQPMVGRMVLPVLGGSPSVWNACMLFFQSALLAGYAYAHLVTRRAAPRSQVVIHSAVLLLPIVALPLALPGDANPPVDHSPVGWLLLSLGATAGLPFFAVATTAPLLQGWFTRVDDPRASDPYFLYAAGNLGSFGALIAYPLVVEPWLSVPQQSRTWTAGYAVFAALVLACGIAARRGRTTHPTLFDDHAPTWRRRLPTRPSISACRRSF